MPRPAYLVTYVDVVGDFVLRLTFADGVVGDVDLSDDLWGPVFEPLKDPAYFRQVRVDPEGGTVVWPNGADVAPETLYQLAGGRLAHAATS
ncbi:MAG TPA: DUF2442 domain-containing protein [Solirubrobacteraceae bacterium]